MRRKIAVPADVRAAIADARLAREKMRAPVPESVTGVQWETVQATCLFCGEEGEAARVAPAADRATSEPALVVCTRTLAEMTSIPPVGDDGAEALLSILDRWMAPRDGEPTAAPWPATDRPCGACGRAATEAAALFAGDAVALCWDCACVAATGRVAEEVRAGLLAEEAKQAQMEIDDLARIRREVHDDAGIRRNATAALSLLRLAAIPDPATREKLLALVRDLDAAGSGTR